MRVGILLEAGEIPSWVADIIIEINQHKNIHLAVLVRVEGRSTKKPKGAFELFRKIDRSLLPGKPNVLEKVKLDLSQVPLVKVKLINGISISAEDLLEIKKHEADILFYAGEEALARDVLTLCKYGVWCLGAGEGTSFGNNSAGFWEWYHQTPVTKVSLLELSSDISKKRCIASRVTKTEYLSLSRNQTAVFSKGIDLLIEELAKLASSQSPIQPTDNMLNNLSAGSYPGEWASLRACLKLMSRIVVKSITKAFFIEQWVLFFSFSSTPILQLDFRNFKTLIPPKHLIWADPFVISENNKHYLFIEELPIKTNKGHISCMVLNDKGEVEKSAIIIDQPFHLSYPFIFKYEETWFMIPESADNSTVDLYECLEFPFKWRFKKSLLTHVRALDSTLYFQDNKYWLFCTIQKRSGSSTNEELCLFYTDHFLTGEWTEHTGNPVLSDPSSARPAGRIFYHDNSWYRPSQICVPRYGYGLSLNRIIKLSESNYIEENVKEAKPDWMKNLLSVHTLNFSNELTVIDGQIKRFRFFK